MNVVRGRTIRSLLEHHAQNSPGKTFLIFESTQGEVEALTFAQLDQKVNRVAAALLDLGIGRGDKFNLHLPNCPEFLLLWFAAGKIGAVMVPTNILSTADELAYIVEHSQSCFSFTEAAHLDVVTQVHHRCSGLRGVVLCRSPETRDGYPPLSALLAGKPTTPPEATVFPEDEAAIAYTSGTTSRPKGVLLTHANYVYAGETVSKGMRLSPEDRHIVVLPLFHVNAQYYSTMTALVVGASMALMERFSASCFFEQARRHEATVASLFAAPIRMILNQPRRPEEAKHRLRLAIFAQNVSEAQLEEWHDRCGVPLMQIYGMTETAGLPTMNPLDYRRKNMTIGTAALGFECKVVDEGGNEVSPGTTGQLLVRGEPGISLMKGYFKNPEATAETIRGDWLWTGDNVWMDGEGYFHFVDRAKDMIKRAGENVAAGEVERVINEHPKVFDSAVIGVPDPIRDEAIKALVILKEGERASPEEVIEWCAHKLAKFKVPESVEFRESLPRTSVGKIQKHILRREVLAAMEHK